MEDRRLVPPFIYCPKCGERLYLEELSGDDLRRIIEDGYAQSGRGICRCGVVAVLCVQPLPSSPTFSLFFNVFTEEAIKKLISPVKNKMG